VAERLRGAIESTVVDLEMHSPLHFSVSIGCASRNAKDDNLDTLLNIADKALYDAKRTGRNRVCVAVQ
jgi:diguanylate cyclase (GGDEF)-like protein